MNQLEGNIIEDYVQGEREVPVIFRDIGGTYNLCRVRHLSAPIHGYPIQEVPSTVRRVAKIARDLTAIFVVSGKNAPWRDLALDTVRVGCLVYVEGATHDTHQGLQKGQMALVSQVVGQVAIFLNDYYKIPKNFIHDDLADIHFPLRTLLENHLPGLDYSILFHDLFQGMITDLLTPEIITKILLGIEFPYGGDDKGQLEFKQFCQTSEQECLLLGNALLNCVDILVNVAKERLISQSSGLLRAKQVFCKMAANVGSEFLRKFSKSIGGYVFAAIDAAFKSDESKALQIIEAWIAHAADPFPTMSREDLREQLSASIRTDFTRLIKYVISEKEGENAFVKEQAGKIIEEITPIIVDMIWDRKSLPIAHLLFSYLPRSFIVNQNRGLEVVLPSNTLRMERLVIQFIQDYLQIKNEKQTHWDGVLISSVKILVRQTLIKQVVREQELHRQTNRLGFLIAAVNAFLTESIQNKHRFDLSNEAIEKPLEAFLHEELVAKFSTHTQQEIAKVAKDLVKSSVKTLLDPMVIGNLILKIKLDFQAEEAIHENIPGYEAVGLEVVRLLRTIFTLGSPNESLSWLDALIASKARSQREKIGSLLAQAVKGAATSNDATLLDLLEKILWSGQQPIFFEGWIHEKEALEKALNIWVEKELLPFIAQIVSSQGFWLGGLINQKLRHMVIRVTEKLFTFMWHEENKAIRVLLYHFILPVFR